MKKESRIGSFYNDWIESWIGEREREKDHKLSNKSNMDFRVMILQRGNQGSENESNLGRMKETTISRQRQRLRWTAELHERFVKAVGQLGGSDSKTDAHKHTHTHIYI